MEPAGGQGRRVGEGEHHECEHCYDHALFEERQKALDCIPSLMSWMNINKGVFLLLAVVLSLMVTVIFNSRSEMKERQVDFERSINDKETAMANSVNLIGRDTMQIRQDVAVMVKTIDMLQKNNEKEIEAMKNKK